MFWDLSIREIMDLIEAYDREEQNDFKKRVSLAFANAEAVASRIIYAFTDKKKRKDKDIVQPWTIYPELFSDELEKAQAREEEIQMEKHKAQMEAYAARWNKRRKEKSHAEK